MKKIEPINIFTSDDLKRLRSSHRIHLLPGHHPRIILQIKNLKSEENEMFSKKINASYYSCGCGEGTAFLLIGLLICIVSFFTIEIPNIKLKHILYGMLFLFTVSILGKIFGMILGKIRLKNSIKDILTKV